jgi:hypothetical protein
MKLPRTATGRRLLLGGGAAALAAPRLSQAQTGLTAR